MQIEFNNFGSLSPNSRTVITRDNSVIIVIDLPHRSRLEQLSRFTNNTSCLHLVNLVNHDVSCVVTFRQIYKKLSVYYRR